jgi:hypothetical protein
MAHLPQAVSKQTLLQKYFGAASDSLEFVGKLSYFDEQKQAGLASELVLGLAFTLGRVT